MNLLEKIKNYFKKGVIKWNMKKEVTELNEAKIIALINKHRKSEQYEWAIKGQRYYEGKQDYQDATTKYKSLEKPDHRLSHAFYRNQINEKVSYSFSKEASIVSLTDADVTVVNEALGRDFNYILSQLAEEASNKGMGWLHVYIDEEGLLKFFVPQSEEMVPIWKDYRNNELDALIRVYKKEVFVNNQFKFVEQVEVWTTTETKVYRFENNQLVYLNEVSDFSINGNPYKWDKIPFIAFRNNRNCTTDLQIVKSLIDNYDLTRSETANYVQEVKNLIWAIKGYSGDPTNLDEINRQINHYRIVVLDADDEEGSDLKAYNPNVDIQALREHAEQAKRDLIESAGAVHKDLDKFGSAPSGVALKQLYSGLELKCTQLENEFKRAFKQVLFFVNGYLSIGKAGIDINDISIVFNHDMTIDEAVIIDNCVKSQGLISQKTIISNHPWVSDVDSELESLEQQSEEHNQATTDEAVIEEDEQQEE